MATDRNDKADWPFFEKCVRAYYRRAPISMRIGIARPPVPPPVSRVQPPDKSWPFAVPPDMWEGPPDKDGFVIWKPVFCDPEPFNPFEPWRGPDAPFLESYLTHVRLCNPLIKTRALAFRLPNAPTHAPTSGIFRLMVDWLDSPGDGSYFAFGETEDGTHLLCLDEKRETGDGDHAIVLIPAEVAFRHRYNPNRAVFERVATPLFPSFRALVTDCLLNNDYPWAGNERSCERVPAHRSGLAPFDWQPLLLAEPGADEAGPDQGKADIAATQADPHLDRIARKIEAMRLADPALLIPGSEAHRYRMNPRLLPAELKEFESTEKCRLPRVYRQLLLRLGNGGFGCGHGSCRLEDSATGNFENYAQGSDSDEKHLQRPFPHRVTWSPPWPLLDEDDPEAEEAYEAYHSLRQIDGTVLLEAPVGLGPTSRQPLLLVVNGPERDHLWSDLRRTPHGGIHPLFRRGPWSLLAWLEGALDNLLARIDGLYANIPNETLATFQQAADEAFGFTREPL